MNPLHAVYGVIIIAIAGYLWHCESVKKAQALAVVVAEAAKEKAEKQAAADRLAKERADVENKRTVADLTARIKRLRAESGVGRLPPAAPDSRRPDLAAFDRAEYSRAYGTLVAGVRSLADEGTAATVALDTAKRWAQ